MDQTPYQRLLTLVQSPTTKKRNHSLSTTAPSTQTTSNVASQCLHTNQLVCHGPTARSINRQHSTDALTPAWTITLPDLQHPGNLPPQGAAHIVPVKERHRKYCTGRLRNDHDLPQDLHQAKTSCAYSMPPTTSGHTLHQGSNQRPLGHVTWNMEHHRYHETAQ